MEVRMGGWMDRWIDLLEFSKLGEENPLFNLGAEVEGYELVCTRKGWDRLFPLYFQIEFGMFNKIFPVLSCG